MNTKKKYNVGDFLFFTYQGTGKRGYLKVKSFATDSDGTIRYREESGWWIKESDVEGKLDGEELAKTEKEYELYLELKDKFY